MSSSVCRNLFLKETVLRRVIKNIMWNILNYVPPRGKRRSELESLAASYGVEVFAPTFVQLSSEGGHVKKTEKPLLYHYIFARGGEQDVKRLCSSLEGFSYVLDRAGSGRHLTVGDEEVEQFRIIAQFYAGKLPCYPLEGVALEEGDRVQIVSGPCAGLTGTYISRKGAKKGNVLVSVDGSMAAVVYDVKADFVRVLEFARDSRRIYDQIDAFAERLTNFFDDASSDGPVEVKPSDIDIISASSIFTRRLGIVKVNNPKLEAKLRILLYAAYSILSDHAETAEALKKYRELEKNVTNAKTRELCETIFKRLPPR